jgi:hypothetical protein
MPHRSLWTGGAGTAFGARLAPARIGQTAEATLAIEGLVEEAACGSGTFELPDLLRIWGEVLLAASEENRHAAEASLMSSLDAARRQSALGWELRSALVLSRWWKDRGRKGEARTLLADVYDRFNEGFDTADLRDAARQLSELGGRQTPHYRSGATQDLVVLARPATSLGDPLTRSSLSAFRPSTSATENIIRV